MIVGALVLVAVLSGCATATYEDEGGSASSTETTDQLSKIEVDRADLDAGAALSADDIECSLSAGSVESFEDVPCDEPHDVESFDLNSDELDDCMATIRASSDIVIVESEQFSSGYDIDDERVIGHAFSGGAGSVSCSITLAEVQSDTLLGN